MNPVAADGSAAAMLEGYRRAMSEYTSVATPRPDGELTLTEVVESATAHAQGLPMRLPGTGERVDRNA